MGQLSYCLDVCVGYDERYREELIEFLKTHGFPFVADTAQRGMWEDKKLLRVFTPQAEKLREQIETFERLGDDNDYEVHYSEVDARRCMTWLPDLDSEFGCHVFSLTEFEPTASLAGK